MVGDLLALLGAHAGSTVDNLDVQLLSALEDGLSLERRDGVADLSGVLAVVHQQQINVTRVEDAELVETARQSELGLPVAAIADLGHRALAAELSAHAVIDTLGLTPAALWGGITSTTSSTA